MPDWDHIAGNLQIDAASRLASEPFFSDVVILEEDKGIVESDVETALGVFNEGTGKKIGAVIVARHPVIAATRSEALGPDVNARLVFDVISLPVINMTNLGTQKRADVIAMRILNALHRYFSGHTGTLLMAGANPVAPINDLPEGNVGYRVTLETDFRLNYADKVATPTLALNEAGDVVMTCATSGAVIHYTLDESYPGPANAEAEIYTTPLDVTGRMVFRLGATLADVLPSDTAWVVVNLQVITTEDGKTLLTEDNKQLGTETPLVEP
jgi:hypothetical protein